MFKLRSIIDFFIPTLCFGGGGGGGQPNTTYSQTSNIPEYAQPYVEQMLGSAQKEIFNYGGIPAQYTTEPVYTTTDGGRGGTGQQVQTGTKQVLVPGTGTEGPTSIKAYQPFSNDPNAYFAGFSPMQRQAQQQAQNMQVTSETGMAADMTLGAGMGALGTQYNPMGAYSEQFGQQQADQYMNPYMQNVVDVQKQAAQRQADIATTGRNAKAVGSSAFGGSRQAIADAEANRALADQQGAIQAQGLNTAYTNAQQQFNADQAARMQAQQANIGQQQFGANLGMLGLQTALQSAGQLGQLGQNIYGQQMGINQLQNQYGAQQQALEQSKINQQIQDYATAQQYPMLQLANMSALTRGLPMQSGTTQMYQAAPSLSSQLAGTALAGYGLSQMGAPAATAKAKGGSVKEKKRPAGLAELALMKMQ
jgi:hypothetical protein